MTLQHLRDVIILIFLGDFLFNFLGTRYARVLTSQRRKGLLRTRIGVTSGLGQAVL